ncbi:MAG: hypothetical protein WAW17_24090 [Rhodococcus sp. (in: high G+C Gram-positive bacteria)]|uniref:hypothetical protein n=1 Tax=Rhodococcus sp. TaxID=1831 RepID=UPI003BAFFCAA
MALIPFDDYPVHQTSEPLAHSGDGHPDQYDRFWFNGYTEDFYFAVALGVYPNRGVIDAAFSVVHDGTQRSVFASGRIPLDRTHTQVGPIRIEIIEPMRINRITVDAPEYGLSADLTAHARTAAYEEPRGIRNVGTIRGWDVTRATQMIEWTGEFSSGGTRIDLAGETVFGTKDRSWGVRPVGQPALSAPVEGSKQMFFLWSPLNFEDICLHYMVHEDSAGQAWSQTSAALPVILDGDPVFGPEANNFRKLENVRHQISWQPGLRRANEAMLHIPAADGIAPEVKLTPLFAFRMKGAGYFHPEWAHGTWRGELVVGGEEASTESLDVLSPECVHLQQIVRAEWGERTGLGVLEQLVVGPYEPAGFHDFLDGAQ